MSSEQVAVLVADDEPHIRLLIEMALEPLADDGVRVTSVADGEAALEAARRERPRVAVLDLMMPGASGIEVCRALKGDPTLAGTAVIILTARGQESDRRHGEEAGADHYLTKPFDPDELLDVVRAALASRRP